MPSEAKAKQAGEAKALAAEMKVSPRFSDVEGPSSLTWVPLASPPRLFPLCPMHRNSPALPQRADFAEARSALLSPGNQGTNRTTNR